MKKHLLKSKVIKLINPHLLTLLPFEEEHEADEVPALDLLRSERFDVMSKYIYAKLSLLNVAADWRFKVYFELQRIFGFKEGDGSGKNSIGDYLKMFDGIIDSMKTDVFNNEINALPVGIDNIIIDGAHRIAASLLFNRRVPIVKFNMTPEKYDYHYFLTRGLGFDVADAMALEFCRLSKQIAIAVVFPVASGRNNEIQAILKEYGQIAYEKPVVFTKLGRHNLIRQLYRGESWLGSEGDITEGLRHHVEKRFVNDRPVTFYFVVCRDILKLKEAKARIRELFPLQNDSIHINDTYEETLRIAEQILTPSSIHFLNHAQPWRSINFLRMFREYQQEIKKHNLDKDLLCIDSGSVLAAYGLRDTQDLDYLHFGTGMSLSPKSDIGSHNGELVHHAYSLDDLLFDPRNYFYYDGMKFLTLQAVRRMKEKRNEAKDVRDILLIDSLSGDVPNFHMVFRRVRFFLKRIYERIANFEPWMFKDVIPQSWHPVARQIYHARYHLSQSFGSLVRKINYKGFTLYYSRGTSLIFNIYTGKTYEPELTWKIQEFLKQKEQPVLLDIGANIGLITLNVLAFVPQVRVFAFEPGPHQYDLFKKTISENKLEHRVLLYGEALGFEVGDAYFNVHNTKDASGDGFFDTGRAGKASRIKVPVNTLDQWWIDTGKPHIDVVKIDAEGAELWILKGAVNFLKECCPIVFLEISEENLKAYPYSMDDIVVYLEKCGYELRTLNGSLVSPDRIREMVQNTQDFMAIHRQTI